MARVIKERIKKPLAEELLFGRLAHGGLVSVSTDDKGLTFTINEEEAVAEVLE